MGGPDDDREYPTHPTADGHIVTNRRLIPDIATQNSLIVDTGGGLYSTVTNKAWKILEFTNKMSEVSCYIPGIKTMQCPTVNAATVARIPNRDEDVILLLNYATYIDDSNQNESLLQPFQAVRHGVSMDLTPLVHGGKQNMVVDDIKLELEFDNEKLFCNIRKPTKHDLNNLEWFELTTPYPVDVLPCRTRQEL
ncbi:MAG: hypothetical protein ACREOZ_00880 [Gloeomargaritales cyanobacterium]